MMIFEMNDGHLREWLLDASSAATSTGANTLHHEVLADMGFCNDEAVDVEAVIVLGVRDGALQQLADILGRTLRRELQLSQRTLDRHAADLLSQKVQLLRARTVHAQNSARFIRSLLRRILGFSHDYFLFAFLSAPWP